MLGPVLLEFGKPVLLLAGGSNDFEVDHPLAYGDAAHGVTMPVPNLMRIVVQILAVGAVFSFVTLELVLAAGGLTSLVCVRLLRARAFTSADQLTLPPSNPA